MFLFLKKRQIKKFNKREENMKSDKQQFILHITINLSLILLFVGITISQINKQNLSLYVGFVSGGVGVALLNIIRNIKIYKDEKYKSKTQIEANDERNILINTKATSITFTILFILIDIAAIVAFILQKMDYLYIFAGIILLSAIIFLITKTILNKLN